MHLKQIFSIFILFFLKPIFSSFFFQNEIRKIKDKYNLFSIVWLLDLEIHNFLKLIIVSLKETQMIWNYES